MSIAQWVPNALELFSTSLAPNFIPGIIPIMKHYPQKEESDDDILVN